MKLFVVWLLLAAQAPYLTPFSSPILSSRKVHALSLKSESWAYHCIWKYKYFLGLLDSFLSFKLTQVSPPSGKPSGCFRLLRQPVQLLTNKAHDRLYCCFYLFMHQPSIKMITPGQDSNLQGSYFMPGTVPGTSHACYNPEALYPLYTLGHWGTYNVSIRYKVSQTLSS